MNNNNKICPILWVLYEIKYIIIDYININYLYF